MSKQELTKWKNKFKLWTVLHPNGVPSCEMCRYYKIKCPKKMVRYVYKTEEVKFIEKIQALNIMSLCLEWLRSKEDG